jgi:hypothetical protein
MSVSIVSPFLPVSTLIACTPRGFSLPEST